MRVFQGGGVLCSLVPFQNCLMFPCSHPLSECFRTVIYRILFPCSQKLANVPLFSSIFCQCSLVPQNPWETLKDRKASSAGADFVNSHYLTKLYTRCFSYLLCFTGGSVSEWFGRWTCNLVVPGSSPPPCYSTDLFSVRLLRVQLLGCAR